MSIRAEEGNYYWSNGYAYGTIDVKKAGDKFSADVKVEAGSLDLKKLVFLDVNNQEVYSVDMSDNTIIKQGNNKEFKL